MKNNSTLFRFILITCCIIFSLPVFALQDRVVARQASVELSISGDYTAIQWEISSDNTTWYAIKNATASTYTYKAVAPAYIRAKQTSGGSTITYSDVTHVIFETKSILKVIKSSGGQGYAETNGKPVSGIYIQEDRGSDGKLMYTAYSNLWTNANASLNWYLYHTLGQYDISLILKITKNVAQKFEFSIIDINKSGLTSDTIKSIISTTGKGVNDTLTVLNVTIPKIGFYKYELKPLNAPNNNITVTGLLFKSLTSSTADVHATNYLSSPSVHLSNWRSTDKTAISGQVYDWAYMEILVPEGGDPLYTYYMSLGVISGYMGIQVNSTTERRILFSQWDNGSTDSDPYLADYLRTGAVDYGEGVTVKRFGGEGTGTQSYLTGVNWKTGTPVKFLTNARLESFNDTLTSSLGVDSIVTRKNTLVSAWFCSDPATGWKYISTLRVANVYKYIDSWYSFLENFGPSNGQMKRTAYYYNGFAYEHSSSPRWIHFNKVDFSHTDGATGQRVDYEQGKSPNNNNYFYMSSGGYINAPVTTSQTSYLITDKTVVDTLDLSTFAARVNEAIANEKARNSTGLITLRANKVTAKIYPNPTSGKLNFVLNADQKKATISLIETNGKEVFSKYIGDINAGEVRQISIPKSLNSGNYIFQFRSNQISRYNQIVSFNK
ncbi:MAG: DUF3472 domain-containing protein [Paludibacteraceae bacterium]